MIQSNLRNVRREIQQRPPTYLIFYSSRPTSNDDMKFLSVANSLMEITLKLKFLFMTSKYEIVTLYSVFKVLLDLGPF